MSQVLSATRSRGVPSAARPASSSVVRHGARTLVAIASAVAAWAAPSAQAADVAGAKDHPVITRFAGAQIREFQVVEFGETSLPIKPVVQQQASVPPDSVLKLEGKLTRISYDVPAGKSSLEVMRNYEQALRSSFTTVFSCAGAACGDHLSGRVEMLSLPQNWRMRYSTADSRYMVAKRSGPDGDVYVQVYAMQESSSQPVLLFQQVVELKAMQTAQVAVLDAAALKTGLDTAGKIAVYGVYFDTGKADVKPESKPTLDEIAKLLAAQRALKVYIVGHTDNAGTLAANLDLSQRRAEAMVRALTTTYKVDAARLVAKGVASLSPVASNGADAGRAKNRRVELVAQ